MSNVMELELNTGSVMPQLGFGVYKIPEDDTTAAVSRALDVGYRSIDTAAMYGNEQGVGRAIADADIDRSQIFVTTKLNNPDHGHDNALRAFDASLARLGLDYVDLYLIHWPQPTRNEYVDTWRALIETRASGRAKAIGVSNFTAEYLQRLIDETGVTPAVNQIELHPYLQQRQMRAFHGEHGIVTEAWSPLAKGRAVLAEPIIATLAEKYRATPAQVVIAWHLAVGNVAIPKSVTPSRISENFEAAGLHLTEDDVRAITELDQGGRIGTHPADNG